MNPSIAGNIFMISIAIQKYNYICNNKIIFMAKQIICLTEEDINISPMGLHYDINISNGMVINLTPSAAISLIDSLMELMDQNNSSSQETAL